MQRKKILIFDEWSFARVCSALLQDAGYGAEIACDIDDLPSARESGTFGLIITSYPFCTPFFRKIKNLGVSTLVLSDDIDENLLVILKYLNSAYCMMKPLDYQKFRSFVKRVMNRKKSARAGSHLVL